ncbi:MAG: glycosyltransferase [Chloroflexi bacterium]|nr:MAG: glycosyltransferase [Chloroflexota bacterium]
MTDTEPILQHPPDSHLEKLDNGYQINISGQGPVAVDKTLGELWQLADGRKPTDLIDEMGKEVNTYLLALRRAGLLLPPLSLPVDEPTTGRLAETPLVSVVIVSRNGRHHLAECLPSITNQTYPNIEIILVDDQSEDDTIRYVQTHFPSIRIIPQTNGPNFAAGCNLGIAAAQGELIFLVNNDTVLDPHCVTELVKTWQADPEAAGVAAMLCFYDNPSFINGLGTTSRRLGFGYDLGIGSLNVGQFDGVKEVPFLCFGAALIPRRMFEIVGPIEEMYQFYYEDGDWSYRARALGFRLLAAPRARVYHKFGGSTGALPSAFKTRLATRNRRWFVLKNLPGKTAVFQLALYTLDDLLRFGLHLARGQFSLARAIASAWVASGQGFAQVWQARQQTWRGRQRHPVSIPELTRPFPLPALYGAMPYLTTELINKQYRPFLHTTIPTPAKQQHILIISPDSVASNMGGVGIRYWELAHQLAKVTQVTLAIPNQTDLTSSTFAIHTYEIGNEDSLRPAVETATILLLSGFTIYHHPFLRQAQQHFIIDLYDPMPLENLERFAHRPINERQLLHNLAIKTFNELFSRGDFFICASEKQRDYWLGALTAANRVNPQTYSNDPTLRRLIDTVPFGLPETPPQSTQKVLKGVRPGIGPQDKVILWGGGLWDWLDPLTVIRAMPLVLEAVPEARLFFLGIKHPNPNVPPSRMAEQALALAEELGLKDRGVFFNEWTPYTERVNYLVEADVGVSLHGDHIETRFAVRTRLMDYLWANLPMVVSGGDILSDLVQVHGLGRVVSAGDVTAVAEALVSMLQSPPDSARFRPVVEQFHWSRVAAPLIQYAQNPWRNPSPGLTDKSATFLMPAATPWYKLPAKALTTLRQQGWHGLRREIQSYLKWIRQL